MKNKIKAIDLAKYIIAKKAEENNHVTNLRLQFLLFYLQAKYLKETGETLFNDKIQAWKFEPCIPEVYYEYSYLGAFLLSLGQECFDYNMIKDILDEKSFSFINRLIDSNRSRDQITNYILSKNGAWNKVFETILYKNSII